MTLTGAAQDVSDAATKSKIAALAGAWNQAHKSGDKQALDGLLDESIVLVTDDGSVMTKAEFLASMKSPGPQAVSQEQHVMLESMSVRLFGNTAIATGNISSQENSGRKILYTARAFCRYVDPQGRAVGLHWNQGHACPSLKESQVHGTAAAFRLPDVTRSFRFSSHLSYPGNET